MYWQKLHSTSSYTINICNLLKNLDAYPATISFNGLNFHLVYDNWVPGHRLCSSISQAEYLKIRPEFNILVLIYFQGIGIDICDEVPAKAPRKPARKTASKANKVAARPASSLAPSPGLQIVSSPTYRSPSLPQHSPSRLTSHDESAAGPSLLKSLLTKSVVNNPAVPATSTGFAFPPGIVIFFTFSSLLSLIQLQYKI